MFGIDKYKESIKRKKVEKISELCKIYKSGSDILLEFHFLTLAMYVSWIEFSGELYAKGVDLKGKKITNTLEKIIRTHNLVVQKDKNDLFLDKLLTFNSLREEKYFTNVDKKYWDDSLKAEFLTSIQLVLGNRFDYVISSLGHHSIYVDVMNEILDKIKHFKDIAEVKKVSKYKDFVGVNLKNWGK
ncbi:MAG: hypothetical protein ACRC6A_09370 [Fusobacteriaceae bacterium]